MKYTRKIQIVKKIITEKDLKELVRVIVEEGEKFEGKVKLELSYKGGLKETADDFSLFEKSIFFGKYVLRRILFTMEEEKQGRGIIIQLEHGKDGDSYITVEGKDPDWVNGKVTQFEDIIRNWKKRYFYVPPGDANYLQFFLFMFLFFTFLFMSSFQELSEEARETSVYLALVFATMITFFYAAILEFGTILWPKVELDVKPSRLSVYRRGFSSVFVTVLLGVVASIIYDLIKKL